MRKLLVAGAIAASALQALASASIVLADQPTDKEPCASGLAVAAAHGQTVPHWSANQKSGQTVPCDTNPTR